MHALNKYKKGDDVQKEDCRLAALQVCKRLSEVHGQDMEELDSHFDPDTGWLSIDAINVLGAANIGSHVDPSPSEVSQDLLEGMSDYRVNCNKMHWTVLKRTVEESWEHINSIVEGGQVHHGQRTLSDGTALLELFGSLTKQYGTFSLHRITSSTQDAGSRFLERHGMRFLQPREVDQATEATGHEARATGQGPRAGSIWDNVSIVTLNVDGLGEYAQSPKQRIAVILECAYLFLLMSCIFKR